MLEKSESTTSRQLTLFAEDSLVNLTVKPGSEKAKQMTATSGRNIAALLRNSDPLLSLVKMCLASEQLFSMTCYLTWKTINTPGKRLLFRLAPSVRRTSGKGSLYSAGMWPTPKAGDADFSTPRTSGRPIEKVTHLQTAVKFWPTPTANSYTGAGHQGRQGGKNLQTAVGGKLNPQWVEWLMGFPVGWTDLEASETP